MNILFDFVYRYITYIALDNTAIQYKTAQHVIHIDERAQHLITIPLSLPPSPILPFLSPS